MTSEGLKEIRKITSPNIFVFSKGIFTSTSFDFEVGALFKILAHPSM